MAVISLDNAFCKNWSFTKFPKTQYIKFFFEWSKQNIIFFMSSFYEFKDIIPNLFIAYSV